MTMKVDWLMPSVVRGQETEEEGEGEREGEGEG